jgi:hypothetical protein
VYETEEDRKITDLLFSTFVMATSGETMRVHSAEGLAVMCLMCHACCSCMVWLLSFIPCTSSARLCNVQTVVPLIETALQELQGLLLDNLPCTKEGSQEDVHPERAGSACGDTFANLVGNSRSGSAFNVVFLSPEHEDYPTIDVPYDDRGSAVAAMSVPSNRSDSGCVQCMLKHTA